MVVVMIQVCGFALTLSILGQSTAERRIEIPLDGSGGLAMRRLVSVLAEASGVAVEAPAASLTLPTQGISGALTRRLLGDTLGPEVGLAFHQGSVVLVVEENALAADRRPDWKRRLEDLAAHTEEAARRQDRYGMRALASYRPNDPSRPTVCLVHGLNSSSGGYVHMIPLIEQAGFGVVVHDYPFNQPLGLSCGEFRRDWAAFRKRFGETQPWAILAHSMGALLARSLVEGDGPQAREATSIIMIAPVNQGAHVARLQSVYQLLSGLTALNVKGTGQAFFKVSEGIGQAADDMLPGSAFLRQINQRPRRAGVAYHILAGDSGFVSRDLRQQAEGQFNAVIRNTGILGRFTRMATGDLTPLLDELSDGSGDGCVAVERTRLEGVADHVILHANHAELIRAPLLYPDPGPVVCMPQVLRWLEADMRPGGPKP